MGTFFLVVVNIFVVGGIVIYIANKGLDNLQGYSISISDLTHIGGIPLLKEGASTYIGLMEDKLEINKSHHLLLDRIKKVEYLTEDKLIDKQKSVIKRAVVGGMLGPLGAVIGGISGVGTKKAKETQHFMSIDFIDKNNQEHSAVFFVGKLGVDDISKFVKQVNEKIGIKAEPEPSILNKYEI